MSLPERVWRARTAILVTVYSLVEIYAALSPEFGWPFSRLNPYYLALVALVVIQLIWSAYKRID